MRNRKKKSVLLFLMVLVLGITVGYAALSTQLKINGSANLAKQTWNVYWSNVSNINTTGDTVADTGVTIKEGTTDEVEFAVTLKTPGDSYEFTVDATNNGSIDAMVDAVSLKFGETDVQYLPPYIKYTVTYLDGTPIRKYHKLAKKSGNTPTTETYKVKVEFLNTITTEQYQALSSSISFGFNFKVDYVQADDYAYDRKYSDLVFTDVPGATNAPVYIGNTLDTTTYPVTNDYTTFTYGNNLQKNVFLGLKLDGSNKITNGYACGLYNGELICLEGLSTDQELYDKNVAKVTAIFGVYDSSTDLGCRLESGGMYNCYVVPGAATQNGNPITYIKQSDGQVMVQNPTGKTSLVMNAGGPMMTTANYSN